jgi:undecaprenyl-diphosphatase
MGLRLSPLLKRVEGRLLIVWVAAAGALWAFLNIGGEVAEGDTATLDRHLLLLLRNPGDPSNPIGPRWLEESMRDVTALGGFTVLTLFTVVAVVTLFFHRKRFHALIFLGTVVAAQVSSELLKGMYERPRPDIVPHGSYVYSASFPSGHSTVSAATYFVLAAVIADLEKTLPAKIFDFTLAALLVIAIGFSRVYLGVHWPSDVLAGWTLGSMWALLAFAILRSTRGSRAESGSATPLAGEA